MGKLGIGNLNKRQLFLIILFFILYIFIFIPIAHSFNSIRFLFILLISVADVEWCYSFTKN
tara:strand:+ start:368 stop:550 length:183 start_codon:yes stop_codon:yes gene_type:complete